MPGSVTQSCRPSKTTNAPSSRTGCVRFRKGRTRQDLTGRIAVIVDDGIATGSTARVACRIARKLGAARVIMAVPVAPADTLNSLTEPDEVVCLATPHQFSAVGYHYRDFSPTDDDEVVQLLDAAAKRLQNSQPASRTPAAADGQDAAELDGEVEIPSRGVRLQGQLHLPVPARGVVLFAHGSGSSRHSPRNRYVAGVLQQAGLSTLLLDLLTPAEDGTGPTSSTSICLRAGCRLPPTGSRSAKIRPPADRLLRREHRCGGRALAAAEPTAGIEAVVSRGGRPDLAGPAAAVHAPTLLIVGGSTPRLWS